MVQVSATSSLTVSVSHTGIRAREAANSLRSSVVSFCLTASIFSPHNVQGVASETTDDVSCLVQTPTPAPRLPKPRCAGPAGARALTFPVPEDDGQNVGVDPARAGRSGETAGELAHHHPVVVQKSQRSVSILAGRRSPGISPTMAW